MILVDLIKRLQQLDNDGYGDAEVVAFNGRQEWDVYSAFVNNGDDEDEIVLHVRANNK